MITFLFGNIATTLLLLLLPVLSLIQALRSNVRRLASLGKFQIGPARQAT